MRLLFIFISIFWVSTVFAQEKPSVLRIKAGASVSVKPTVTIVSLSIEAVNENYNGAVQEMNERVNKLTNAISSLNDDGIKQFTSTLSVNKNQDYVKGQYVDNGFKSTQKIELQFTYDNTRLVKVLNTATSSTANPKFSIKYDLDPLSKNTLQEELIKKAVENATVKATTLVSQTEYILDGIQEINYGIDYYKSDYYYRNTQLINLDANLELSSFEVMNLSFTEQVDIIFYLKKK